MSEKTSISQIEVKEIYNQTGGTTIDYIGGGGSVFSDVIYVGGYTHITGYVYSNAASATDGLVIEQAQSAALFPAGTAATANITKSSMTYTAADMVSNALSVQIVAPFVRLHYTNGASSQTAFNIYFCARVIRGL